MKSAHVLVALLYCVKKIDLMKDIKLPWFNSLQCPSSVS